MKSNYPINKKRREKKNKKQQNQNTKEDWQRTLLVQTAQYKGMENVGKSSPIAKTSKQKY